MSERIVLWGEGLWDSPWVMSVYITLREKGVAFEERSLVLDGDQHHEPFASLSKTERVPMLQHGDFAISESIAIIEYLDETFPPPAFSPVLPTDAKDRAVARQIMGWLRSDLLALRAERPTSSFVIEPVKEPLSEKAREAVKKLERVANRFLDGREQLFERASIVDIELALAIMRCVHNGDDIDPILATFAKHVWSRSSVRAFLDHERDKSLHKS